MLRSGYRRFGVEIELNALGSQLPLCLPAGIHYLANIVSKTLGEYTEIRQWGYTTWDKSHGYWVVKPDGSCGLEICSPLMKPGYELQRICQVVDALSQDPKAQADDRCSLHVHVDISDCCTNEIGSIIDHWIKCEPVFVDAVPIARKLNNYCQCVGLRDWFATDKTYESEELIQIMGEQKYLSINTYHLHNERRKSIEFRLGGADLCKSSYDLRNWLYLLLHFVEMAKIKRRPQPWVAGDVWSSWLWLDPKEVFELLGFGQELSPELNEARNWFLARLVANPMVDETRQLAYAQAIEMAESLKRDQTI